MRFLMKIAIFGFLALLLLPSIYPDAVNNDDLSKTDDQVSVGQMALSAATFAAGFAQDLQNLCERDRHVCAHGSVVVRMTMERARHGARIALALVQPSSNAQSVDEQLVTGSVQEKF